MNLQKVSKKLSVLLRHCREPLYIDLNGGWAEADEMVFVLQKSYQGFNRELLSRIVETDEKGRYSFDASGARIRANQGHSIPGVVIEMEEPEPPELLYHGTASRFLPAIFEKGLLPMSRQFVHLSPDIPTAIKVGSRHGAPVVLAIQARRFVSDGHVLKRSENGVWQAQSVPAEYLSLLENEQERLD